jgi:hypothetical protein
MKYLIVPGNVTSKNDGEVHFISAQKLIQLYKVNPKLCITISWDKYVREFLEREDPPGRYQGLIVLRPRSDGNYILESKENE